jgi:predicted glycosyltransferase
MTSARILFYCHNAIGLGHVIRSLRIAEAAEAEGARCGILTGCRFLSTLSVPREIDVELLPPVRLDASGRPVALDANDGIDIIAVRSQRIVAFIERWRPDAIVVDHHPLGLGGELLDVLLKGDSRFILGVCYSEASAMRPYRNPRLRTAVGQYQSVLDYSDCDASAALVLTDDVAKLRIVQVGIVTKPPPAAREPGPRPRLVVLAGGGAGGADMYRLVIDAMRDLPEWDLRILVGPLGDMAAVTALTCERA